MLKSFRTMYLNRYLANYVCYFSSKTEAPDLGLKKKKRVGDDNIRVTLISGNEDLSIVSLAEAHKISKRRSLKLVKIVDLDTKTARPVYKLMSAADFHEEELKKRHEKKEARNKPHFKSEKLLQISGTMAKHDMDTKLRKLQKWLFKYHEVRAVLTSDGKAFSTVEEAFTKIQDIVKDVGVIKQKQVAKGSSIKFQIRPDLEKIETLKQDPEYQKKHAKMLEHEDSIEEDEDTLNGESEKIIEVNLSNAKQASFVSKS